MTRALSDEDLFTLELESSPSETGTVLGPSPLLTTGHMAWYWQEMNGRNYPGPIIDFLWIPMSGVRTKCWAMPKSLLAGMAHRLLESMRSPCRHTNQQECFWRPKSGSRRTIRVFHSSLGIAYAATGQKEEAVREGRNAVELKADCQGCLPRIPYVEESWRIGFMC